jgi:hypothetical protein
MDCPVSSFWITGQMAKRKRTDVVKLQLRIREGLRRKLETRANAEERSLNSEIAHRLENSFDQENYSLVLQALLAPGAGLELIRNVGAILRGAGRDWNNPPKSHAVAEAIRKVIAVLSGELPPTEESFPNRNERGSADQLAYLAGLIRTFQEPGREGAARPLAKLIRAMEEDRATHK